MTRQDDEQMTQTVGADGLVGWDRPALLDGTSRGVMPWTPRRWSWVLSLLLIPLLAAGTIWGLRTIERQVEDAAEQMLTDSGITTDTLTFDAEYRDIVVGGVIGPGSDALELERILEDTKGRNLMPIGFMRQLIGLYDDNLNTVVPRYLEVSMENFARHQGQMREYMEETVGRFFPLKQLDAIKPFEEMARQNMALFQKAASIFTPPPGESVEQKVEATAQEVAAEAAALGHQVETLRTEMENLRQQMSSLQFAEPPVKKP